MSPALINQNDFVAMTQATAGMLLGQALAPGLDVAGFRMTDQVSDESTVTGAVSWSTTGQALAGRQVSVRAGNILVSGRVEAYP